MMDRIRVLHFMICSIGIFFNSFAFSFNVIGGSVKSAFSLTQSQVELISSLYFMGTHLNLIPGYFYDKYGALYTARIGVVLTWFAWASATVLCGYSQTLTGHYFIISMTFLCAGQGKSFVLLPIMVSGLNTFSRQHRGKALSFLATLYTIGPLTSIFIFNTHFSSGDGIDAERHNLTQFVLFLGVSLFSAGLMFCCSPFHYKLSPSKQAEGRNTENSGRYFYSDLICHGDVILYAWVFALILGTSVTFETNVPFFSESLNLSSKSTLLIVLHRLGQGTSRLAMGLMVDYIKSITIRVTIFLLFAVSSMVSLYLWTTRLADFHHVMAASTFTGLARGVYGVFLLVVCEKYDYVNHGKIFALGDTFLGLTIWLQQAVFGAFYDSAISTSSETVCRGEKCLIWTVPFLTTVTAIGVVLILIILKRRKHYDQSLEKALSPLPSGSHK